MTNIVKATTAEFNPVRFPSIHQARQLILKRVPHIIPISQAGVHCMSNFTLCLSNNISSSVNIVHPWQPAFFLRNAIRASWISLLMMVTSSTVKQFRMWLVQNGFKFRLCRGGNVYNLHICESISSLLSNLFACWLHCREINFRWYQ